MTTPPIAVLSDIHGNRWALEAVLDDIRRRGIRDMVNLGDCLYGPLDPSGTARILMELGMPTVRGNEDRIILDEPGRHPGSPSLPFVQGSLKPEHLDWLKTLPPTACAFDDLFLCHGTPDRDDAYLLWEVRESGCRRLPADAIARRLQAVPQPVVLCGHDHLPALLALPDGRHVVDPGSVGLPAYRDHSPYPHVMEAGSPHARYSVIQSLPSGLAVEAIAIPYAWQSAVATAAENSRADWAEYLRTGRAGGLDAAVIP
jgi:diadenosine tetraphosphatase ApaH/serine/threonine PP2A family protein phosphatase